MVARVEPYVAPGRTRTIQVGYYYDLYSFQQVSGARFSSSNKRVLTVSKAGIVTGVAPGDAKVNVSISGQRLTVSIGVRTQMVWSSGVRGSASMTWSTSILHGVGFTPNSEVQFTTNGVYGVSVDPSAAVDSQGTFSGTIAPDGWMTSGPSMTVESDGMFPGCASGDVWIVTATDVTGSSSSISGTCY
jgi:hypothetical protein